YSSAGVASFLGHHCVAVRPVIALFQGAPGRLHYVVIVSWTASRVVVHDPALVPFRPMSADAFERTWTASGRWMLLVLPPEDGIRTAGRPDDASSVPASCAADVARGVALAGSGRIDAAKRALQAAHASCPESSAPLTELAGVQLLQADYAAAENAARQATRLDSDDLHGWRTLATTLFLEHQPEAA